MVPPVPARSHEDVRVLRAFGMRVRRLRQAAGMSQEQLAMRAGIHPTYLSGIERGERNVSLLNVNALADGLGVAPSRLFG